MLRSSETLNGHPAAEDAKSRGSIERIEPMIAEEQKEILSQCIPLNSSCSRILSMGKEERMNEQKYFFQSW